MIGTINVPSQSTIDLYLHNNPYLKTIAGMLSYDNIISNIRDLVIALMLGVSIITGHSALCRLYTADIYSFYCFVLVSAIAVSIAIINFLPSKDGKKRMSSKQRKLFTILFSLFLTVPSIIQGEPWLFFLLTNLLVGNNDYLLVLAGHAFLYFLTRFNFPQTFLTALNFCPGILAFICTLEDRINSTWQTKLSLFHCHRTITGAATVLAVFISIFYIIQTNPYIHINTSPIDV
ncbi:hypothetical protein NEPAR06_0201 [Nematocida parisii]|uniref:Uncharacterized protein n=1 Tax=Nematocida parisii (strain ERTm3) TaxID=935791 RepID=I3EDD2_NEMP3|nr:uncharacterized protein NEPG_00597 [Nematocida parisii ERTm1]EIJ87229.1 hypothetical protein NEQG_02564 [Nematocida parisii ERTm3]KAI5126612.1 hypothetical protein NEPAR08_0531 [Nematocida parisii]EIJ95072.1 hypothetical protein NEPG_00597 [Nematocida parisii ERTm1]KAI5127895.1 hypothetical protein NEPAR03_1175 [Nematocida parisii]KAI5143166.1 hypothetical protein NEPAR07_0528 [Nematocida parisii]|eukprot:XP_013058428.1 hypothetical protein NEPG_00597 [Nematocida parisii ERTm1]